MKTQFIPIDYDYFDFQGRNHVRIIGRNEKKERICLIDTCPIYLWAILKRDVTEKKLANLISKIQKIQIEKSGRLTRIEKIEAHKKKFLGKDVQALKIFVTNYKDLQEVANYLDFPEIEKRRGHDLGFVTHYIIEKGIRPFYWYEIEGNAIIGKEDFGGIADALEVEKCLKLKSLKLLKKESFQPKILAYDIECDELKIGEGEILMISLAGSSGIRKVITWKKLSKKKNPSYVEYVKDEAELLEKFVKEVKKESPDFLVGYFSDNFDLPYLRARAKKFNINLSLGLDGSQPKFSRGNMLTGRINGIVHIDLLRFVRTAYSQYMQSETLALNEVAKEFLGDTKKDFKIKHSSKLDEEQLEKYYEYNLHDSVLTMQLLEKFWPDLKEFSRVIKEPAFEVSRNGMSKNVESYIIHKLEDYDEIPERRPGHSEIGERRQREKYEGAFVFEPTPGIYENISMWDFTSYWPSIIVTFNLSRSTLLEKKEKGSQEAEVWGKKFYFQKEKGFFPLMLQEIIDKRKKYKKELAKEFNAITKARSNAFKLLANASYGYMGFFGARYYAPEASGAATAISRDFIKKTIEKINKEGFQTIYSDTDSIAFLMNEKTRTEVKKFLKKVNNDLPGIMELELEGFFKRGIWVTTRDGKIGAKKKYALIDENKKIKIRGFETVRRDWCKLARETQNKIIKLILEDGNEERAKKFIKSIISKLKERKISREKLIIKTQLKKPLSEYKSISPHVVAAKRMKEQKIPISEGGLIEYYIAEPKDKKRKLVRERVRLPDEEDIYDIEYYLKNQILPAVENIFQLFKININELIEGKKQTCLGDF